MSRSCLLLLIVAAFTFGAACRNRPEADHPAPLERAYIDIEPGWRLRVVAPILKSGGFDMHIKEQRQENGVVVLKTGEDFEGYETDFYTVTSKGDGLNVKLSSARITRPDKKEMRPLRPLDSILDLPRDTQSLRLLFLVRESESDHDQAVLMAASAPDMDALTNAVLEHPIENCRAQTQATCAWVPRGIVIRPEKKDGRTWVPAL